MSKIRPGDYVKHIPSGEEWVVAGVNYEKGYLIPCGYPFPSQAKIEDCELTDSNGEPQTEDMKNALRRYGMGNYIEQDDEIIAEVEG